MMIEQISKNQIFADLESTINFDVQKHSELEYFQMKAISPYSFNILKQFFDIYTNRQFNSFVNFPINMHEILYLRDIEIISNNTKDFVLMDS